MNRYGLAFTSLAIIATMGAVPDRPSPPPSTKPVLTDMESNWGKVKVTGKQISITGHPVWFAEGHIRDDGTVLLIWTLRATDEPCPGVYRIVPNGAKPKLEGEWGRSGTVTIEKDGSLSGATQSDRVFEIVPVEPDIH